MKRIILTVLLFIIDGIMMFLFKQFPSFFFPGYRIVTKNMMFLFSSIFSFTTFSIWDIFLILMILIFIVSFIYTIFKKKNIINFFINSILIVSILAFIAVNGWMLNHYGPSLAEELKLSVSNYSKEELYEATDYYFKKATEYASLIERDKDNHALVKDFKEMSKIAGSSYEELAKEYSIFKGSNKPVKRFTIIGDYLLYNGIVGMFMPITGEASIPHHVPPVPMPFHMCHETAHRLCIAGEDEANFAAFLACINNTNTNFIYSGYYEAFAYCFNALYKTDSDLALKLYNNYDDAGVSLLKLDRKDTAAIYQKYESKLQEISDQINDTYLKTFDEESGIQSYGEVVDYLIAYYKQLNNPS